MIDLIKAKKAFKEYLKGYDITEPSIKSKVVHTYNVINMSEYLSKELKLDKEKTELAKLIALLHDIGRFEQRTGDNKEFEDFIGLDHAEYGCHILFEEGLIRNFTQDDKYDNIIYKAIINHNRYAIEDGLDEETLLQAKIIRDADKLDNFRVKDTEDFSSMFKYNPETINYETISPKVYEDFMNHKTINVKERITQIDIWISFIAFIFDFNYDISAKYILDNNYINRVINRIEYRNEDTKKKMEEIRRCANQYLLKRVKDVK